MRNVSEIMREGQEKSLVQIELLKKKMAGTLTEAEQTQLTMLEGNLLGLVAEAQAQGVGVNVDSGGDSLDEDAYDEDAYDEDAYDENYYVSHGYGSW